MLLWKKLKNQWHKIMIRLGAVLVLLPVLALQAQSVPTVVVLTVKDAIGPASSDYIHHGLEEAKSRQAAMVILQLDTPGGLDTAMRDIIRDMLASPIPIVVYVSPSGARAASAGTYMLYASHVAAMAPATNLGAATPVQIGGLPEIIPSNPAPDKETPGGSEDNETEAEDQEQEEVNQEAPLPGDAMTRKLVNDAVAYIRSLAEMRGRNAEWAEQAVRQAASLSAEKALEENVIDVLAEDIDDLLRQINGRSVEVNDKEIQLDTTNVVVEHIMPDWRNRFLSVITNPNIAYILMLLGIYGLILELYNPGAVLPGVIGGICLLLALYSMQALPVNYAGLGLILLGIAFMVAEIFMPSFGALGIGGFIAFVVGSIILFDVEGGNIGVSLSLIFTIAALSAAFFFILLRMAIKAHGKPVVAGAEEMLGSIGEVLQDFDTSGQLHVHGENWQVESDVPMKKGSQARVIERSGLILKVEPVDKEEKTP